MATLISAADVLQQAALPVAFGNNNRLVGPVAAAEKELRRWVGDTAVDAAITTPTVDQLETDALKLACCYLALYYAWPALVTHARTNGVLRQETSETSHTLEYLTPKEVREQREMFLESAKAAAEPYMSTVKGGIYAGGISQADKDANEANTDTVRGKFRKDLFDYPGMPNAPYSPLSREY